MLPALVFTNISQAHIHRQPIGATNLLQVSRLHVNEDAAGAGGLAKYDGICSDEC